MHAPYEFSIQTVIKVVDSYGPHGAYEPTRCVPTLPVRIRKVVDFYGRNISQLTVCISATVLDMSGRLVSDFRSIDLTTT